MLAALENVLDGVKPVNGFWSMSDQNLVRANILEVCAMLLYRQD